MKYNFIESEIDIERINTYIKQVNLLPLTHIKQEGKQDLYQIGSDGAMLYGDKIDVYYFEIEELRKLSPEISERIEKSLHYYDSWDQFYDESLNLAEIEWLYKYKKSEWFHKKILKQNQYYFINNLEL